MKVTVYKESFRVNRSNLLKVCARTDPDLNSLVVFYVIHKILQNYRQIGVGPSMDFQQIGMVDME